MEYTVADCYPFHMPGHKRKLFLEEKSPYSYDITEIEGFDNLHEAQGILKQAMEAAAKLYHTKNTYYLINGSTCGLLSAISAATNRKDTILVARNSHKAVYNAILLRELRPKYLYPRMISEYNLAGGIHPEDVESALKEDETISVVVITSPTYDGIVSDIRTIAQIVHRYKKILIVDEAHGAHFPFSDSFPESAIECGADLVIQSIHKTLPSLTQTALLHRVSERVDEKKLHKYLSIYQSSSPSYVLMGAIERCLSYVKTAENEFKLYIKRLETFYEEVKNLKNIVILKDLNSSQIYKKDDSKVIIYAKCGEISGVWLYNRLLKEFNIQPEMVTKDYVTCLSSVCDTKEGFDRLRNALYLLDQRIEAMKQSKLQRQTTDHSTSQFLHNEMVYLPFEVEDFDTKTLPLDQCENEVAAEYIYLYPPGIPIIVPGERISFELLVRLAEYQKEGLSLKGMADGTGQFMEVMKEKC